MRKNFYLALLTLLLITAGTSSYGQYSTAVGVRLGYTTGLTLKHFLNDKAALEMILSNRFTNRGFMLTGLYEMHASPFKVDGLSVFYGGGAHVGSFNGLYYNTRKGLSYGTDRIFTFGLDLILGLEYQVSEIPVTFGIDIKPYFDLYNAGSGYGDGALTIRYILK